MAQKRYTIASPRQFFVVSLLVLIFIGLLIVTIQPSKFLKNKGNIPYVVKPHSIVLTGKTTCLPRIPGPDGSIMADCVYGFLSETGDYYILNDPSNGNTNTWFENPLYTAEKVKIKGLLSNEKSEEFDIVGKITLESFTILQTSPTNQPEME